VNRATFFGPDGPLGHQDKQVMTRFERETWNVVPGGPLRVFDTALGRIGVLICYDAEFPLLGRALDRGGRRNPAGAILHRGNCGLFPRARRRHGPRAGRAMRRRPCAHGRPGRLVPGGRPQHGAAAIYGPPDLGFPETGVLAQGDLNAPGWVTADIDRTAIARVRRSGAVFNHAHWPESASRAHVSGT
jgi:predicted amidohydrolase